MKFKTELKKIGNSVGLLIPTHIVKYELENKIDGIVEIEMNFCKRNKNAVYWNQSPNLAIL